MTKFEAGQTYTCRSPGDYDCIFSFKVIARSRTMVTLDYHGNQSRRKIRIRDGVEECDPHGRYSIHVKESQVAICSQVNSLPRQFRID